MPNKEGMEVAVDIAGEHSGNFIHLDVDPYKMQGVIWTY